LIDRPADNRARRCGGDATLARRPKVSGGGARARSISIRALARVFDAAEKAGEKAGDSFVTVERKMLARRRADKAAEDWLAATVGEPVDQCAAQRAHRPTRIGRKRHMR
jgi:hypothetical protein